MGQILTERTELAEAPASGDFFHVVDVSDTTDSAEGTSKKVQAQYLTIDDASTTVKGKVELATTAETTTGTDATRAVTPDGLHDMTSLSGAAWFLDQDAMTDDSATKVPSQQSVKAYVDTKATTEKADLTKYSNLYATQGFLINGKISVTDAAGITVAIKTLAGTDPSATDPVYCRIGDTVRSITSALSVVKADGTNWFNAGSAELATKEIDYFVYLAYRASDSSVVMFFSRRPGETDGASVGTVTTGEYYGALSGGANLAAGDYCELIGRFAATLSAGAGYTWSVPTFTAENLIQRPIYETRNLSWLPTYSASSSMTWTSVTTTSATYKLTGKVCDIFFRAIGTTGGTASTELRFSIPVSTTDTNLTGCGNTADTSFQGGGATYFVSAAVIGVVKQAVANWGLGALRRCETNMRFPI